MLPNGIGYRVSGTPFFGLDWNVLVEELRFVTKPDTDFDPYTGIPLALLGGASRGGGGRPGRHRRPGRRRVGGRGVHSSTFSAQRKHFFVEYAE